MADEKSISGLVSAPDVNENTLVEVAIEDLSTPSHYASYQSALGFIFDKILNGTLFNTRLKTIAKTVFGAINELFEDKNIADQFSTSATYDVDDYVIYEGTLYKCTTAVTTAGAWDSTKWTAVLVTDEMGSGALPAVTSADKDKELMVILENGEYKWGISSLINDGSSQGLKHTYSIDKIRTVIADSIIGGKLTSANINDDIYRKTNVVYKLVDMANITNAPVSTGTGILKVYNPFPTQAWCIQEVIAFNQTSGGDISNYTVYYRHYMSGTLGWSAWYKMPLEIILTGTLVAGNTSITLSNSAISSTSTLDVYTDVYGVNPTAISVSSGTVTLTFESQASDLGVKVRIS